MKYLVNGSLKQAIHELLASGNDQNLMEFLHELQPFDIATLLPEFEEPEQLKILSLTEPEIAAESLEHLNHDDQYRLLDHLPEHIARDILARMSDDAVADLVLAIHPRQAQEILRRVPKEDLAGIRLLMTYPDDSAGGIMSLDYIAVREDWSVSRVINHFRKVGSKATVTNAHQEEAAKLLSRYDFVALPVTEDDGRLVGVIAVDDILDVIEEEDTEDIHKLGGSQPLDEPYMNSSLFELVRKRMGWLLMLFIAEGLTGNILKSYEDVLAQVVALTFFIPLLTDTGGNSGSQASTMVIRAMALGEVTFKDVAKILWKELRIGAMLGLIMGTAGFIFSWVIGGSQTVALTVSVTLMFILMLSSTLGAVLPLIGTKFGVDPAVFSAPLITTIVDATGLLVYFAVASRILNL